MSNGLFTVTLDFGAGAFDGSARWLQIAARPATSRRLHDAARWLMRENAQFRVIRGGRDFEVKTEQDFVELLPEFSRLTKLDLVGSPIRTETARVLGMLTNPVDLNLSGTRMGDGELAMLSDLHRLKTLYLGATRVTDDGVAAFERDHPQCKIER